jgi:hypothetical protein
MVYNSTAGKWENYSISGATFNDSTKTITVSASTANNLASATTTVNVSSATAPSANQALIATSSTSATWQTLSSTSAVLSDFSVSSINNGDVLRYNTTTGKWNNSNTLTSDETNIINLQLASSVTVSQSSVTQNTAITTGYTDGTNSNIINVNNSVPYFLTIAGLTGVMAGSGGFFSYSGTSIVNTGNYDINSSSSSSYSRLNIKFSGTSQYQFYSLTYSYSYLANSGNITISVYGSTSAAAYSDSGNDTTGLTFLASYSPSSSGTLNISNTSSYQYMHLIYTLTSSISSSCQTTNLQIKRAAGGYLGLVNGTDFTVTTNSSSGVPVITYTDSATNNLIWNLDTLLVSEAYRRLYPVIRNSSDLVLASTSTALTGYGAVWNIENYNNTLNHNYNGTTEFSISSTGVVTMGTPLSVTYGGSGLASTTAYGVLCGGTTTTGALQNAGAGTANYA